PVTPAGSASKARVAAADSPATSTMSSDGAPRANEMAMYSAYRESILSDVWGRLGTSTSLDCGLGLIYRPVRLRKKSRNFRLPPGRNQMRHMEPVRHRRPAGRRRVIGAIGAVVLAASVAAAPPAL